VHPNSILLIIKVKRLELLNNEYPHNPYAVPAGLEDPAEDGQEEMEASPMNSNKALTNSHNLEEQGEPSLQDRNSWFWGQGYVYDATVVHSTDFRRNPPRQLLPFVLWDTLKFNALDNMSNAKDAVYNWLTVLLILLGLKKTFTIFPHHLNEYQWVEDLLPVINDVEKLPEEVDNGL